MNARYANPLEKRKAAAARRLQIFSFVLSLGYLTLIGRALILMVQNNDHLETMALHQYRAAIQPEVNRRRILDRQGKELAISVPAWSLYADPSEVKNPRALAQTLSKFLGISKQVLQQKLRQSGRFVWLKRRVNADVIKKVKQNQGIYSFRENKRYYPHGTLAGNVLGAVGIDAQALGGIELAYDRYLMMKPKSGVYLRDAKGRLYLAATSFSLEGPKDKGDVYLTLDKNLQLIAEQALGEAVQKHQAEGGVALLMDPATGNILAMANFPSFDPNRFDQMSQPRWRNRAVTDSYEPGSTFKVVFVAAALEEGLVTLSEKFHCENGELRLSSGHVIHDHKPHGLLSVEEIVKVSSNIGAYKVSRRLKKKKMYEWIKAFGFGQKTGIDFPSESKGLVRPYQHWHTTDEATIAFGQGIGVTPLQMLAFFGTIANHGVQMQPHLVEKVMGSGGEILYQAVHQVQRTPLSPKTVRQLVQILKGVVEPGGTATLAFMDDYLVAGKTGTSQKSVPGIRGYLPGKYVASFVGFAPLENPKLVGLVLIDEPSGGYTGGQVAAPVFKEMMLRALQSLGVRPKGEEENRVPPPPDTKVEPYVAMMLKPNGNYFEVPNFAGATLRHVLQALGPYPVAVELKGRGLAFRQRPMAGTLVLAGSKIYVEFAPR